ncbi:Cif family virulence factor [Nocardia suismassiliense]|uniref:nuclear transport factor 2 family protein n=1 Tax=Nocardia suismassiliense TaxID=2077092 RepID=UPI000D1FBCB9|nr:nuclear transport factor 2 family protein [Nocardia suismassiliense]
MVTHDPAVADQRVSHGTAAVHNFVRRYDDTVKAADFGTLPSFFDETILVVTPSSSLCLSRAEFVAAVESRVRQLDSVPELELVEQSTTELGGHYWLTSVQWALTFGDGRAIEVYSDLLIRRVDGGLRIAAYLTRQDLPELLRAADGRD